MMSDMETTRNLVYVLAISFGISVLTGTFDVSMSEWLTILLGGVDVVCIVWLVILVSKKGK